jgi:hypothetical protein
LEQGRMKTAHRHTAAAFLVALCCFVTCLGNTVAGQPQPQQLSPGEQKEYDLIQKRFRDHEDLLNAAGGTLSHCADAKDSQGVEKTLNLLKAFADSRQIQKLVEAGGVKPFKDNVAILLRNKDPVVRGFGAVLLALIGDAGFKSDIAQLLQDKPGSPPSGLDRLLYNWDRSQAAVALGLLGAKEYAPRLDALLRSSDPVDRAGAALGLGYMDAKDHAKDIAKLLSDDEDQVQAAALQALGELNAVEHAKDVARLLTSGGDPSVAETASYALARLNAKKNASDLVPLLHDQFRKGYASKALALLGAKEYTEDIAILIEDSDPLVRCDALIALGILDARDYDKNIGIHLRDKEAFVRAHAAIALLLMGDRKYSTEVEEVVLTEWKLPELVRDGVDTTTYFSVRLRLHPVVADRQQGLVAHTVQEWQRIHRSEKPLQQGGAATGRQPIDSETNSTSGAAGSRR